MKTFLIDDSILPDIIEKAKEEVKSIVEQIMETDEDDTPMKPDMGTIEDMVDGIVHEAVPESIVVLQDIVYSLIMKEVSEWYEEYEKE